MTARIRAPASSRAMWRSIKRSYVKSSRAARAVAVARARPMCPIVAGIRSCIWSDNASILPGAAAHTSYNRGVFTRRRRPKGSQQVHRAGAAFRDVMGHVDEAKATLLLGVPGGRTARIPLAEALVGFEQGLRDARAGMASWRVGAVEAEWMSCAKALDRAAERAERLRLEVPTDAYEELVSLLDELLDPLDAFGAAASRLRSLGA